MLIIGAGGFAKQLTQSLHLDKKGDKLNFFDDTGSNKIFLGKYPIVNSTTEVQRLFSSNKEFLLGVGSPKVRQKLSEQFMALQGNLATHVSNQSFISPFSVTIESGNIVMPKAYIEPDVYIGEGTLINVGAFIAHDVQIGRYSEISPNAQLLGGSNIGKGVFIGAGAVVLPNVKIGDNCTIGAGAVVTKDIPNGSTVVGVPGHVIKTNN